MDVVVTRHESLVEYLKELGLIDDQTKVISHNVTPEEIRGKNVCGILPYSLSCLCKTYTEVGNPVCYPNANSLRGRTTSG